MIQMSRGNSFVVKSRIDSKMTNPISIGGQINSMPSKLQSQKFKKNKAGKKKNLAIQNQMIESLLNSQQSRYDDWTSNDSKEENSLPVGSGKAYLD